MMMNNIKLCNLVKTYSDKNIINDLSYTFNVGNLYIVKGHSGCGKSTLLSLIGLLDTTTSGKILFDEKEVKETNTFAADNISYVFQDNNIFDDLTVLENLSLVSSDKDKILSVLKELKIDNKINSLTSTLSTGEKSRVVLCRIILEAKPIVLLDEPIANLDKENAELVLSTISKLSNDRLIILVMHNDISLDSYEHVLLTMEDGKITSNTNIKEKQCSVIASDNYLKQDISIRFAKTILRKNKFKSFFYIFFQALISFIIFIFIGVSTFNLNGEMIRILSKNNIDNLSVVYEGKNNDSLYRETNVSVSQNDSTFYLDIIYSKNDSFVFDDTKYSVTDNTIYLPNDVITSNNLDITEKLIVEGIELNISATDVNYNLVSNNTITSIARNMSHNLSSEKLMNYLKSTREYFGYLNYSFTILSNNSLEGLDTSNVSTLKENEVNIILPKIGDYSLEEIFNNIKDKSINLKEESDMFILSDILNNVTIKGYTTIENTSRIGLQLNEDQYNEIISNSFNNGLLNDTRKDSYLLTSSNYKSFDLTSNIERYLDQCNLTRDDIHSLTMIKQIKNVSVYVILFVVLINIATIYFVSNGISRSFSVSKNLLYTLGYKRESIIKINLVFMNFIALISLLISLVLYLSLSNVLSNVYLNILKTTLSFALFGFSWGIIIFVLVLLVFINIFNVFYKTKKNSVLLLESMKKTLE